MKLRSSMLGLCTLLAPVQADHVISLTQQNFEESTSKGRWLLNFHAPWCTHCKRLAPVYDKVAKHFHEDGTSDVHVAKIDATSEMDLAERFDISGYPSIVLYQGGEVFHHKGHRTFDAIVAFVERHNPQTSKPVGAGKADKTSADMAALGTRALELAQQARDYVRQVFTTLTIPQVTWLYWRLGVSVSGLIFVAMASIQYLDRPREE
jgi:protein disulfide-isomerase-like protein